MSLIHRLNPFRARHPARDALTLTSPRLTFEAAHEQVSVWRTAEGDPVGVYLFSVPPDLPVEAPTEAVFLSQYRALVTSSGAGLLECRILTVPPFRALSSIASVPQQPSGRTYLGSITLPFRDFSFVVKLQCQESGVTGVRDAVVFNRLLAEGRAQIGPDGAVHSATTADDPSFDAEFPEHPVSRVRRELPVIADAVSFTRSLQSFPRFNLPAGAA